MAKAAAAQPPTPAAGPPTGAPAANAMKPEALAAAALTTSKPAESVDYDALRALIPDDDGGDDAPAERESDPEVTKPAIPSKIKPKTDPDPKPDEPPDEVAEEGAEGEPADAKPERPIDRVFAAQKRKADKLRRERDAFVREKQDAERQWQARMAELKALEAQTRQYADLARLAKEDPAKALEALGLDFGAVAEAQLRAGSPEAKVDAMARELAALRKEQAERERRDAEARHAQQQAVVRQQAHREFIKFARENESNYAALAAFDDAEIASYGDMMADALANEGKPVTYEAVAKGIDEFFAKRFARLSSQRHGGRDTPDSEQDTDEGEPRKPEAPRAQLRSLSNRVASARTASSVKRPRTEEEELRAARKLLA